MTVLLPETKTDVISTAGAPSPIDALASPDVSRSTVLRALTSPETMTELFNARLSDDLNVLHCRPRVLKNRLGSRQVVSYRLKIANGKLHDPAEAERALSEDEGDFVAIAKGALADPAWPRKIAAGVEPIPFDPAMVNPLATLANTLAWRQQQAAE
ncbi:MAG: hypothetical protein O7A65_08275 [Proteobacteria bacterium]|nr:hypothetical protein [Pseudomonadota bacterium]